MSVLSNQYAAYPGIMVPGLIYPSQPLADGMIGAASSVFVDRRNSRWRQDKESTVLFWKNIKGDF